MKKAARTPEEFLFDVSSAEDKQFLSEKLLRQIDAATVRILEERFINRAAIDRVVQVFEKIEGRLSNAPTYLKDLAANIQRNLMERRRHLQKIIISPRSS